MKEGDFMNLIPKINGNIEIKENICFLIKESLTIRNADFSELGIEVFSERLNSKCGILVSHSDLSSDPSIDLIKDSSIQKDGYKIDISDEQIKIYSKNDAGVTNALTSLYVLIVDAIKNSNRNLKGVSITDYPKFEHRGLLVDVSRNFFGVSVMKKIIEEMALNKLNVLHWHLSDDQGWRIESKVFPKLTENQAHYSQDEIRDVIKYAEARGVEIIPEIDMPGHVTALLTAYPNLSCFDEKVELVNCAGVFKTVLCPGKESTYTWVFKLLDEMVQLFPSKKFHIGGDEVPKTNWKSCPHCLALMKKDNISNFDDLQYAFTKRITEHLIQHGKEVICWNETLRSKEVEKNITTQYWVEFTEESYCLPYFNEGYEVIFSDMFNNYFDYPYSIVTLQKTYDYTPSLKASNVLGIEGATWTERVGTPEILEYMISPRINALAESAWTINRNYEDFLIRLKVYMEDLKLITLNCAPFEAATISGEAAKEESKQFLMMMFELLQTSDIDMGLDESEKQVMLSKFLNNIFDEKTAAEFINQLM
ncbi:hypothetical protein CN692_21555 [Bacillus sp. AFS002410]|nr:hypothetical protein CN692_21555 [Bacillus sp. AFS002410]